MNTVSAAPPRPILDQALDDAEASTLAELRALREPLRRAVEAVASHDEAAAREVAAQAGEFERRYADVHEKLLSLIARQAPVATDLRRAIALLHVNERADRIGAQCLNIATMCLAMPPHSRPSPSQIDCLREMAALADGQISEATDIFAARDVEGARRLRDHDAAINAHNRDCFALAIAEGDDEERREAALFVALMARALERVGDNAVDIGHQATFVATGRFRAPDGP